MKKINKKITAWAFTAVSLIIITGGFVGYKMYTKPHRSVEEAIAVKVSAQELVSAYENNEAEANTKFLDKVLEVQGEVNEVSKNQKGEPVIIIKGTDMSGLLCTLDGTVAPELKPNASVVIKGICTGFLTDVVLVRCILKN